MRTRSLLAALAMVALANACGSASETASTPATSPPVTIPSSSATTSSTPSTAATTTTTTTTSTTATTASTTTSTTTTTTTTPPAPLLAQGASGPEVAALQARLHDLGYWFDDDLGSFGRSTAHAVVAFQKRAGLGRDGIAGPLTLAALAGADRPTAQSTDGHVVEVDLDTQTLLLVEDGTVQWVFDTSTGAVAGTTPRGHWSVYWQVDGYDRSPLGILYRPKYFYEGVAVHGYPSVPSYPASHGCVRVLDEAMDFLWSTDALPYGTPVWVY